MGLRDFRLHNVLTMAHPRLRAVVDDYEHHLAIHYTIRAIYP